MSTTVLRELVGDHRQPQCRLLLSVVLEVQPEAQADVEAVWFWQVEQDSEDWAAR